MNTSVPGSRRFGAASMIFDSPGFTSMEKPRSMSATLGAATISVIRLTLYDARAWRAKRRPTWGPKWCAGGPLFCFRGVAMLGAIQARAIRLYCVEEQSALGAILLWVRNDRNRIARFVRRASPAHTEHEVNARSLDIPRSDRGRVRRVRPNRDETAGSK